MDRAKSSQDGQYPKIHFFNTFFYETLNKSGYEKVRKWSKKVNSFLFFSFF